MWATLESNQAANRISGGPRHQLGRCPLLPAFPCPSSEIEDTLYPAFRSLPPARAPAQVLIRQDRRVQLRARAPVPGRVPEMLHLRPAGLAESSPAPAECHLFPFRSLAATPGTCGSTYCLSSAGGYGTACIFSRYMPRGRQNIRSPAVSRPTGFKPVPAPCRFTFHNVTCFQIFLRITYPIKEASTPYCSAIRR